MVKSHNNYTCEGVLSTGAKCKLSRASRNAPIQMSKKCSKCKEWRCRAHCRCARQGQAHGRGASRGALGGAGSSSNGGQAARAPAVVNSTRVEVLEGIDAAVGELSTARSVVIATYVYDDAKLHKELLRKLASGAFSLELLVDAQQFSSTSSRAMKSSVQQLQRSGATVRLCRGRRRGRFHGSFHHKVMIIDERIAFVGSANYTSASRTNLETVLRLAGPCVQGILANVLRGRWGSSPPE